MGEQDKGDADGLELAFSWGKKAEKITTAPSIWKKMSQYKKEII